jgi:ATP-dependent helicase HepA
VIECVAPSELHSDRFMPATPIRVQVNHQGEDYSEQFHLDADDLRSGNLHKLMSQEKFRREMLPMMLDKCREISVVNMEPVVRVALEASDAALQSEIDRLVALGEINDHVSDEEIDALCSQRDDLHHAISKSRLRLDSVRIIFCQAAL